MPESRPKAEVGSRELWWLVAGEQGGEDALRNGAGCCWRVGRGREVVVVVERVVDGDTVVDGVVDGETVVDGGCWVVVVRERIVDGASVVGSWCRWPVEGWCRWPVEAGVVERVVDGETVVDGGCWVVVVRERIVDGWCRWAVEGWCRY